MSRPLELPLPRWIRPHEANWIVRRNKSWLSCRCSQQHPFAPQETFEHSFDGFEFKRQMHVGRHVNFELATFGELSHSLIIFASLGYHTSSFEASHFPFPSLSCLCG